MEHTGQLLLIAAGIEAAAMAAAAWQGFLRPRGQRMRRMHRKATGTVADYARGKWDETAEAYPYFPVVRFTARGRAYTAVCTDRFAHDLIAGTGDEKELLILYDGAPEIGEAMDVHYNPRDPRESRLAGDAMRYPLLAGWSMIGIGYGAALLAAACALLTGG